jgi:glycosyltransferase involved in cell wall biosynthesis
MKVITLVPVKNEAWIIEHALKNFSSFSDYVIVADQGSTDETVAICRRFEKVKVINNPYKAHTNQIRWLLLDEARKIEGNNLIVCLDADELLSPNSISEILSNKPQDTRPVAIYAEWIQLLNNYTEHRVDGVWKGNYKQFAFFDDRVIDYDKKFVSNDHTNRIPNIPRAIHTKYPILHLQYLAKERCELKQIYYMCTDLVSGKNARKINNQYSVAKFSKLTETEKCNKNWFIDIVLPPMKIFEASDLAKIKQIYELFTQKGLLFFEPLDIWNIKELRDHFIKNVGRSPKVKKFPVLLVRLNDLKNKIKNKIQL